MLNIPFEDNSRWKVMRMGDEGIMRTIREEKAKGRIVIIFAHVGMLFTRYPNPVTFDYLHDCADSGADAIVTCHSHCLGGMEDYDGVPIFHSLSDFCMDGNSVLRRTAALLTLNISHDNIDWELSPTFTNDELEISLLTNDRKEKILKNVRIVSQNISRHKGDYERFFKNQ